MDLSHHGPAAEAGLMVARDPAMLCQLWQRRNCNRALTATTLGISMRVLRKKASDHERDGTRIPRRIAAAA